MNELTELQKQEIMDVLGAESISIKKYDEIITSDMIVYPLSDISSLGAAFSGMSSIFSAIGKSAKSGKTLYEAVLPKGAHLAAAKDGSGLIGSAVVDGKGMVGQARFKAVGKTAQTAGGAATVFIAIAIMAINHSLKNISENQNNILTFLEADKATRLKGDLITLSDIISEYRHNWNNPQFITNRELQALDIKRNAEHDIIFYRDMIEKKFAKKQFIHIDTAKTLNDVNNKFMYYRLALYLYSFSSFLDVLLLQNFDNAYLDDVSAKIRNYASDYDLFYENTIKEIEGYAGSSIQSRALQGLSAATGFVGNQISKIPDKNNKINIDNKLIKGSEKLDKFQAKSITDTTSEFVKLKDSGISIFTEKIDLLNMIYNNSIKIAVDENNLYLSKANA